MTNETESPSHEPSTTPRWLIRAALVMAVLMVIGLMAAVGWRWLHVQFPNAALFVRGDETVEGTEVVVSNMAGVPVFSGRLTSKNAYQLVVLVEHDIYHVLARHDGKMLVNDRLYINGAGMELHVVPPSTRAASRPATAPATAPAAPVDASGV